MANIQLLFLSALALSLSLALACFSYPFSGHDHSRTSNDHTGKGGCTVLAICERILIYSIKHAPTVLGEEGTRTAVGSRVAQRITEAKRDKKRGKSASGSLGKTGIRAENWQLPETRIESSFANWNSQLPLPCPSFHTIGPLMQSLALPGTPGGSLRHTNVMLNDIRFDHNPPGQIPLCLFCVTIYLSPVNPPRCLMLLAYAATPVVSNL